MDLSPRRKGTTQSKEMAVESEDLEINSDNQFTMAEISIEDEEKPFLGFDDWEADIKPPAFYKDLISFQYTKNLVPFISDLIENTSAASGDEVPNLKNIKKEWSIYEENSENHTSNFDEQVPDGLEEHLANQGISFTKELVPVIKTENDYSNPKNNKISTLSVENRQRLKYSVESENSKLLFLPQKNIINKRVFTKKSLPLNTANTTMNNNNHADSNDLCKMHQDDEEIQEEFSGTTELNGRGCPSSYEDSEIHELPKSHPDLPTSLYENCNIDGDECEHGAKGSDEPFVSDDCRFETSESKTFETHQNTHNDKTPCARKHECKCCEETHLQDHNKKHTHKKDQPVSKPFSCQQCPFRTTQYRSLTRHIKTLHKRLPSISCSQCDFKCYNKKKLSNHMIVHSGKSYFECTDCDYKHRVQAVVKRHMVIHKDRETLKCRFCSYRGVLPEYVQKHMEKHHNYTIRKCTDKTDPNNENTTSKSTENGNDNNTCDSSENGKENNFIDSTEKVKNTSITLDNKYLVIRLPKCDSNIKIKTCNKIDVNEFHERNLRECEDASSLIADDDEELENDTDKHSTAGDLSLASDTCKLKERRSYVTNKITVLKQTDKKVSSTMNVSSKTHYSSVIDVKEDTSAAKTKERDEKVPLTEIIFKIQTSDLTSKNIKKCDDCTYTTTSVSEFETHTKKHNNNEKPFMCDICGVSYGSKNSLYRHKKLKHINRKPYKCELCDFKCALHQYLKCHMLTHTNNKPFACDRCEFTCSTAANLKLHNLRHDGIKPFSCSFCDFRCDTKAYLKIHSFIHTGETKFICKICNFKSARKAYLDKHMKIHKNSQ